MTDDEQRAYHLYLTMETPWLHELRAAFVLDRAAATYEHAVDFIDGRIFLIDRVLIERGEVPGD